MPDVPECGVLGNCESPAPFAWPFSRFLFSTLLPLLPSSELAAELGAYLRHTAITDATEAINQIARFLNIKPAFFGTARPKDRRAVTSQRVSIRRLYHDLEADGAGDRTGNVQEPCHS
ncbi:uncharacterized protein F4807DRAFT_472915 [Annulohypoxylon truncatum]|uniref:uncharacterized protein n=1 Tax=Annulohypoxylon truncatum TaxID=327061 RepID=UPI002008C260|nr:uncharacterized protein F4807DRAFT_472915 [Annulohypoxylon truncatum]KAI1212148.1 hypothetical protein F4807DRAFT_472915 [Annulohypoxylon truncatum]